MDKVIIYTGENGNVIVVISTGALPIETVQAKDIPAGVESFIVERSTLPLMYEEFLNAWEQVGGVVSVNLDKAKLLKKQQLRMKRVPLLLQLDVDFQRALERGDSTTEIVAEKQRLRDITDIVDAVDTVDALLNINPFD
jgi:hypothetical protein